MSRLIAAIFSLFLSSQLCFAYGEADGRSAVNAQNSGSCSAISQNFTDAEWVETDTQNIITSVTASTITYANEGNKQADVTKDFGVNYFDSDWSLRYKLTPTSNSGYFMNVFGAVRNNVSGDIYDTINDSGFNARFLKHEGNTTPYYRNFIVEDGSASATDGPNSSDSTVYYVTVLHDADGGTNSTGITQIIIRTGSHTGTIVGTPFDRSAAVGETFDGRYLTIYDSYDRAVYATSAGTISDLEVYDGCLVEPIQ